MAGAKRKILTVGEFARATMTILDGYNNERAHRSLGGEVPRVVFDGDKTPLEFIRPELVARALMRREKGVTVQHDGVVLDGVKYFHADLFDLIGSEVDLGWLDQRPDFVEVFYRKNGTGEGAWICRATANQHASPGMVGRVYKKREHTIKTVKSVHAAADRMAEGDIDIFRGSEPQHDTTAGRAPRPRNATTTRSGQSARDKALKRIESLKKDGTFK
jgi:hypothetical protein